MRSSLRFPKDPNLLGGGSRIPPLFRAHSPQRHSGHLLALGCACSNGGSPGSCVTRGCVPTGARRSFLLQPFHHPASLRGEGRARRRQIGTCWLCEMAAGQQGKVHVCVCVCAGRAEPPAAAGMLSGAAFGFVRILNGEGRRGAQGAKRGGGGRRRSRRGRVCIWKRAFYECVRIEINRKGPIQALTSRKRGAAFHPRLNCFRLCRPAGRFGLWGLAGSPPPPPSRCGSAPHAGLRLGLGRPPICHRNGSAEPHGDACWEMEEEAPPLPFQEARSDALERPQVGYGTGKPHSPQRWCPSSKKDGWKRNAASSSTLSSPVGSLARRPGFLPMHPMPATDAAEIAVAKGSRRCWEAKFTRRGGDRCKSPRSARLGAELCCWCCFQALPGRAAAPVGLFNEDGSVA